MMKKTTRKKAKAIKLYPGYFIHKGGLIYTYSGKGWWYGPGGSLRTNEIKKRFPDWFLYSDGNKANLGMVKDVL